MGFKIVKKLGGEEKIDHIHNNRRNHLLKSDRIRLDDTYQTYLQRTSCSLLWTTWEAQAARLHACASPRSPVVSWHWRRTSAAQSSSSSRLGLLALASTGQQPAYGTPQPAWSVLPSPASPVTARVHVCAQPWVPSRVPFVQEGLFFRVSSGHVVGCRVRPNCIRTDTKETMNDALWKRLWKTSSNLRLILKSRTWSWLPLSKNKSLLLTV